MPIYHSLKIVYKSIKRFFSDSKNSCYLLTIISVLKITILALALRFPPQKLLMKTINKQQHHIINAESNNILLKFCTVRVSVRNYLSVLLSIKYKQTMYVWYSFARIYIQFQSWSLSNNCAQLMNTQKFVYTHADKSREIIRKSSIIEFTTA